MQNREKRKLSSSCLSVCMEQVSNYWNNFRGIWHFSIFRKYVQKIKAHWILRKIKDNLHKYLWKYISRWIFLRMRNISGIILNIITYYFFLRKHVFYEIIRKDTEYIFCFHCKNGYAKALHCYSVRKLLVLL